MFTIQKQKFPSGIISKITKRLVIFSRIVFLLTCGNLYNYPGDYYEDDEEKARFLDENKVDQDQDHVHRDPDHFLLNKSLVRQSL